MPLSNESIKNLEKALTPENKSNIEKVFDSVNLCTCYSGQFIEEYLRNLIGDAQTNLIKNMLDSYDFKSVEEHLKGASPDTLYYLRTIYAKYAVKFRGVMSRTILRKPDSWTSLFHLATRYDLNNNEVLVKLSIDKLNKECVILEDTYDNMFILLSGILESMADNNKIEQFKDYIDISKEDIEKMRKHLNLLEKKIHPEDVKQNIKK